MSDNGSSDVAVNDYNDNNSEKLIADLYNDLNYVSQRNLGEMRRILQWECPFQIVM